MWRSRWRSERGAVLVHTAVAIVGLLGFSAFSLDYGILWVSRRQAQNAADAAALAAAISMAYGDKTDTARMRAVARSAAAENPVWGEAPSVLDSDVTIGPCPPGSPGIADTCVRVDVYRNQERQNSLPTFFGRLLGVNEQGVRASATSQIAAGASSNCVRPWAIPDKWDDKYDEDAPKDAIWAMDDSFDMYDTKAKPPVLLGNPDVYTPPSASSPGTGFTTTNDIGRRVMMKFRDPNSPNNPLGAGNFLPIALPLSGDPSKGGDDYRENIAKCNGTTLKVGDSVWTEPGGMVGPTKQGMEELVAQDTGAIWQCSEPAAADGSCKGTVVSSKNPSPRVVPVPVFDVAQYEVDRVINGEKANGRHQLKITRMLGFFIEDLQPNGDVVGRLTYYPSNGGISDNAITDNANFLRVILLVR